MNPLQSAEQELRLLLATKEEVEKKMKAVRESIKLLEPVYRKASSWEPWMKAFTDMAPSLGITDAVEYLMVCMRHTWLAPTDVRDGLRSSHVVLAGSNPLSSIHQILKRLRKRGVLISSGLGTKTLYRLNPALSDEKLEMYASSLSVKMDGSK